MDARDRIDELQDLLGMTRTEAEASVRESEVGDAVLNERARVRQLVLDEMRHRVDAMEAADEGAAIDGSYHRGAASALYGIAALLEDE